MAMSIAVVFLPGVHGGAKALRAENVACAKATDTIVAEAG